MTSQEGALGRKGVLGGDGVSGFRVVPGAAGGGALGREHVGELQRARILAAMTELVRERGVGGITVAHVVDRSGVSRRTFYELFEDREDCLLAAFDHAVERATAVVIPAYEAAGTCWEDRVRAGLAALLGFLEQEPALGGLCVVDAFAAERVLLERRARIVDALAEAIHRGAHARRCGAGRDGIAPGFTGRGASGPARGAGVARGVGAKSRGGGGVPSGAGRVPGRIVAEGTVGAVLAVIHARMCEPSPKPLSGLLGPLMGIVVLPYLGPAAAERELARPAPRTRKRPTPPSDPLRELDMRLTYRTVRVLLAIADLAGHGSGPSGRQVADAAGISDQGQISKLLWRLEHLGLIHNHAPNSGKGEPNAWTLTPKGHQIEQAIRTQTNN